MPMPVRPHPILLSLLSLSLAPGLPMQALSYKPSPQRERHTWPACLPSPPAYRPGKAGECLGVPRAARATPVRTARPPSRRETSTCERVRERVQPLVKRLTTGGETSACETAPPRLRPPPPLSPPFSPPPSAPPAYAPPPPPPPPAHTRHFHLRTGTAAAGPPPGRRRGRRAGSLPVAASLFPATFFPPSAFQTSRPAAAVAADGPTPARRRGSRGRDPPPGNRPEAAGMPPLPPPPHQARVRLGRARSTAWVAPGRVNPGRGNTGRVNTGRVNTGRFNAGRVNAGRVNPGRV